MKLLRYLLLLAFMFMAVDVGAGPQTPPDPREAFRVYVHDLWQVEDGVPQNSIQSIAQTTNGYLWLGTETGLVRFNGTQFKVFNHKNTGGLKDDYILSLFADDDGSLWIGTRQGGLTRLHNDRFEQVSDGGSSHSRVTAILRDRDHKLVLGTKAGLKQLVHGALGNLRWPGLAADEDITDLRLGRDDDLWIGTESSGLIRIRPSGTVRYTTAQGLSSNKILSLCKDRAGNMWIGTDGGGIDEFKGRPLLCVRSA